MAVHITTLSNGSIVEFDNGKFDKWCVFITIHSYRYAPKDLQYFSELNALGNIYGHDNIYNDFVEVYTQTSKQINKLILSRISEIAQKYTNHKNEIETWFTVIYAGMIAEENKQHAILKKRIKRLGMHQLLIERKTPGYAANFSKGRKWRDLHAIMNELGF